MKRRSELINATQLLKNRENVDLEKVVRNKLQSAPQFLHRLELEAELNGHVGCVNCVEWSEDGQLLASGSDDLTIKIWDPFRYKLVTEINSPHRGNIFSVKFMPKTNNHTVISGAADNRIYVFDLNRPESPTWSCRCHTNRIKRLAVAPEEPFVFWSAAEDGDVFEFDLREPHVCHSNKVSLINLKNHFKEAQAKCIAVNPRRSEFIAIGSNDCYARMYDRRMMMLDSLANRGTSEEISDASCPDLIPRNCATYFCPGHLRKYPESSYKAITYLTFNSDGTELLVNMGAEQIYLYDINNNKEPCFLNLPEVKPLSSPESPTCDVKVVRKGRNGSSSSSSNHHNHPPDTTTGLEGTSSSSSHHHSTHKSSSSKCDRRNGSKKRRELDYHNFDRWDLDLNSIENRRSSREIITHLTQLIKKGPLAPRTIFNRAAQLMMRGFYGDTYAALRDIHTALWIDPDYVIGYYRLAQCLFKLHYHTEAYECLQELKTRFPSYVDHIDVKNLELRITDIMRKSHQYRVPAFQDLPLTENESYWRQTAKDYKDRFVGHCNTTTDIKEASFFGNDSNFIIAGSDDGNFYIWERPTNLVTQVYKGDQNIVNCVNPHPTICMLATSGIEHAVKVWSPQPVENFIPKHRVDFSEKTVKRNQDRMFRARRMH